MQRDVRSLRWRLVARTLVQVLPAAWLGRQPAAGPPKRCPPRPAEGQRAHRLSPALPSMVTLPMSTRVSPPSMPRPHAQCAASRDPRPARSTHPQMASRRWALICAGSMQQARGDCSPPARRWLAAPARQRRLASHLRGCRCLQMSGMPTEQWPLHRQLQSADYAPSWEQQRHLMAERWAVALRRRCSAPPQPPACSSPSLRLRLSLHPLHRWTCWNA